MQRPAEAARYVLRRTFLVAMLKYPDVHIATRPTLGAVFLSSGTTARTASPVWNPATGCTPFAFMLGKAYELIRHITQGSYPAALIHKSFNFLG